MIHFREITEENFDAIIKMKRPEQEGYVASNAYSLAQAWLYRDANDVYPFAIYNDDEPVGFMLLDKDLWFRQMFMADEETMSYNHNWGGAIPFPEEEWNARSLRQSQKVKWNLFSGLS